MSQPDLLRELRESRPVAPSEVRERVRLVVAQAPPQRRVSLRRAAIVLVPACAAVIAAAIVLPRGHDNRVAVTTMPAVVGAPTAPAAADKGYLSGKAREAVPFSAVGAPDALGAIDVPSPRGRVVRYSTYLELRVKDAAAISDSTKRAVRITTSLGGHLASVNVSARNRAGNATLILRIPRGNVQKAVARLSELGTIVAENVSIEDVTASLDQTDRTIARLQKQLGELRALPQTDATARKIAALTRQIESLQRAKANAIRAARYATVQLELTTHKPAAKPAHHGTGPLHGLGVAFRWLGIGLVYALALGTPLVVLAVLLWLAARAVRRRREDALLSSP